MDGQNSELNAPALESPGTPIEGESFAAVMGEKTQPAKASQPAPTKTSKGTGQEPEAKAKAAVSAGPAPEGAGARTREKLHRASTAARGAIEGNVKRVERIRQVSSVVLEEAHYDPSLRFVLAAVVLFIIVTALLVLSKVMG